MLLMNPAFHWETRFLLICCTESTVSAGTQSVSEKRNRLLHLLPHTHASGLNYMGFNTDLPLCLRALCSWVEGFNNSALNVHLSECVYLGTFTHSFICEWRWFAWPEMRLWPCCSIKCSYSKSYYCLEQESQTHFTPWATFSPLWA